MKTVIAYLGCSLLFAPSSLAIAQESGPTDPTVPHVLSAEVNSSNESDDPDKELSDGFQVRTEIILLRTQMLELEPDKALAAMERSGQVAMDRVTVEMLRSITRTSDEDRRIAAGKALVEIGERAAELGHREFAGSIGEGIYLSAQPEEVRKRAYPLFMLLDTERAKRHRELHGR